MNQRRSGDRVILAVAPWASTARPSLAAGLLQAAAAAGGVACETVYLNVDFASVIGVRVYEEIASDSSLFPIAEHFFAADLFGAEAIASDRFLAEHASSYAPGSGRNIALPLRTLYALRDLVVPASLDTWTRRLLDARPTIVGFSCVFNQVLASLALARRIKLANPEITTVLGGACVHGVMGRSYARAFRHFVDHVFTGEADVSFPAWLAARASEANVEVPGMTTDGCEMAPPSLVLNLDALPTPNYDDFFAERKQLAAKGCETGEVMTLPFESARGCWWGEKHHCTFCGLNNEGMRFRRKSPDRVAAEISTLADRYGCTDFSAADNILTADGYSVLLPRLARLGIGARYFYEIKANVRRDDVAMLASSGVQRVQPGIESFSDHVLQLMRKGVTAAQNVQLLTRLTEFDVGVVFNVLVGFPGERDEDYQEMSRLLPRLFHLPAPLLGRTIRVQVHRFSPFFDDPQHLGLRRVRPAAFYRNLIPPRILPAKDFAYFFEHDDPPNAPCRRHQPELDELLKAWAASSRRMRGELHARGTRLVTETNGRASVVKFDRRHTLALLLCDSVTSPAKLSSDLAVHGVEDDRVIQEIIGDLEHQGAIVRAGAHLVACVPWSERYSSDTVRTWIKRMSGSVSLSRE
jgi:ribosomal peptide maturation radical SAM protein 1